MCPIRKVSQAALTKKVRLRLAFASELQEAEPDVNIILIAVRAPSRPDESAGTGHAEGTILQSFVKVDIIRRPKYEI